MRTPSASLPAPARDHRVVHEAIWAPIVGLVLLGARFLPLERLPVIACPFHVMTGFPCLTCGGTRSVAALARFDLAEALAMNPLVALGGIAGAVYVMHAIGVWLGRRRPWRPAAGSARTEGWLRLAALAAIALNWAYLIAAGR